MPPAEPQENKTPKWVKRRIRTLQREIDRLEGNIPRLILPCGCKIEQHDYSAIMVKYCARHVSFHYSPHHEKGDVFYFVTEDKRP